MSETTTEERKMNAAEPTYRVTHDRISPEPDEMTERELRAMLADLHADDPDAGWNIALEVTDDAIYAVGPDWLSGREEIAERVLDRPTFTTKRRTYTDEYGSGREIEITGYAYRLSDEELAEHELDPAKPWTVRLGGTETNYGPGGAVLNQNSAQWDPDGEWRQDMRADEPDEADCRTTVEIVLDSYLDALADEEWLAR